MALVRRNACAAQKKPCNKYSSVLTRQNGGPSRPEEIRILTFAIMLSTRRIREKYRPRFLSDRVDASRELVQATPRPRNSRACPPVGRRMISVAVWQNRSPPLQEPAENVRDSSFVAELVPIVETPRGINARPRKRLLFSVRVSTSAR